MLATVPLETQLFTLLLETHSARKKEAIWPQSGEGRNRVFYTSFTDEVDKRDHLA